MIYAKNLGLSDNLSSRFEEWTRKYTDKHPDEISSKEIDQEGRELAHLLKKELGDSVIVVYASETEPQKDEVIS